MNAFHRSSRFTMACVLLPFGLGYFLSYLFRTVNAVIGPEVASRLGLGAAEIGLVTSAYFLAFAAFQIPLGVLLDRYEPRRVEPLLLLVAAAGALVFSVGETATTLALGRGLIGLGVSACLMGAMKANVAWWPPERLALANGTILAIGGVGALVATAPTQAALHVMDWRAIFVLLAAATVVVAAAIAVVVPKTPTRAGAEAWGPAFAGAVKVFAQPAFLRLAPVAVLSQACFLSYHGLWAAVWIEQIDGLGRDETSLVLATATVAIVVGMFAWAFVADRLGKRGVSVLAVAVGGSALNLLVQLALVMRLPMSPALAWSAFAFCGTSSTLYFSLVPRVFPAHLSGRALTALNMLIFAAAFLLQWLVGVALTRLVAGGAAAAEAHSAILGSILALEALALAWLLWAERAGAREALPRSGGSTG